MIVAAGQAAASSGDLTANVATATRLTRAAADRGAAVLVLPEAFLTGYDEAAFAGSLPTVADLEGPLLDPLRAAAAAGEVTVVLGTALRRGTERRLSSVVLRPDGRTHAAYDKQHLDPGERHLFSAGDGAASVAVGGVDLGLAICYDTSFPEHAAAAAAAGAVGYLCSIAYFPGGEHRRDLHHAARALDNGFYVVVAALTGRCGPHTFVGGSAVYDPEGRPLARLGTEEGLAVAELDPERVRATRERHRMHHDRQAAAPAGLPA